VAAVKQVARVEIREARAEDIPALARLAGELGYATDEAQMRHRFERVAADPEHRVYVAEAAAGTVVGWVHVHLTRYLATDIRGEIAGLIVASSARSQGIGARLLSAAENWTKAQGGAVLSLRSNVVRKDAHRFYERSGYAVTKTSLNFRKSL
jgi:ribosomal protein S18 acetylase RimI-like enzyme